MTSPPSTPSAVRLTNRDIQAVTWIAQQQAVRLDTIGRMLSACGASIHGRSLRRLAERWAAAGLVQRRRILAEAPSIVWPTVEGLRCAGIALKPGQRADAPSIGTLHHTLAVAEVRLAYEQQGYAWTAERFLRGNGGGIKKNNRGHISGYAAGDLPGGVQKKQSDSAGDCPALDGSED